MNIQEVAVDCGRSDATIRRWIKSKGLPSKKNGFKGEIFIDPMEWKDFCDEHRIERRGEK